MTISCRWRRLRPQRILPFSFEVSVKIIQDSQGSHFDPIIVWLFRECAEKLYAEICTEDEALLHNKLEECISRYFN